MLSGKPFAPGVGVATQMHDGVAALQIHADFFATGFCIKMGQLASCARLNVQHKPVGVIHKSGLVLYQRK